MCASKSLFHKKNKINTSKRPWIYFFYIFACEKNEIVIITTPKQTFYETNPYTCSHGYTIMYWSAC